MCGGGRWLRPFKADALLIIAVTSFSIRQAASKRGGGGEEEIFGLFRILTEI